MKYSQLMFHSAVRTVAMDVTVPQAVHTDPGSSSAFQFHFLPYAHQFDAPRAICQQDAKFRTSPHSDSRNEAMFNGSHHYLPTSDPGSPAAVKVTACPERLNAKHPTSWSKDDVEEWLDWSGKEFDLDDVQLKKFSMNGKALCILSKEGFSYRAPNAGDFLHELLQKLISRGTPFIFNQLPTDMQMTPSVSANEEMAHMRRLGTTKTSNFQQHRRTPPSYKQEHQAGDESTGPAHEQTSRLRMFDKFNRDYYESSNSGGKPNTPELVPLNLKKTDSANESCSSSGHSTPHAALDEEPQQSPHTMTAFHHGYPPHLPPYPTVHPKTLQEPRCKESSAHHDTTTGQKTQSHIYFPAYCSSPPSGKSPTNHLSSGNLNQKSNLSPFSSLPHRQSHTGAEDYNPQQKHHREMMEAHLSSSEDCLNSTAPPSRDVSFDNRPVLREILIGRDSGPSSVLPHSQMKVHNNVHVPVIQKTAAVVTNGNTCTRVSTNCSSNQRSDSISCDSLANQRDILSHVPFSHQYPYRLGPSVRQALTCERSPPSVFSNMFDVKTLCDPKVEVATSIMDCNSQKDGAGKKKGHRPLLWQFLWLLLKDKNYLHSICWEDEALLVFRIIDTEKVAKLWGKEKNRVNMTYEKMSRGMRYYYNTGILCKEHGQKLTYRFLQSPEDLVNSRHFSKNKMKTNAACDAESKEARICQEADSPRSVSSERDSESAEEMSSPGSASTTIMASSPRCDTPIVMTAVAKEVIKIKKEHDDLGYPLS